MARRRLVLASVLALASAPGSALADPAGCPYLATSEPAPFDRSDVINDRVTESDPTAAGHLAITPTASAPTCAAPDTAPPATDADSQFHYKAYLFRNYANASACVSVTVYHAGEGQPLQVAAYSPSFDPSAVTANYLAAVHDDALSVYQFSFTVAPTTDFEVVLDNAVPAGQAGADDSGTYQLLVGGCGEPGGEDAGAQDASGVTTDVSGTDPAPPPGSTDDGQSATPPTPSRHSNGALPANESFGDCNFTLGPPRSPRDALFIALAVAFVSCRRRSRRPRA